MQPFLALTTICFPAGAQALQHTPALPTALFHYMRLLFLGAFGCLAHLSTALIPCMPTKRPPVALAGAATNDAPPPCNLGLGMQRCRRGLLHVPAAMGSPRLPTDFHCTFPVALPTGMAPTL